MGVGTCRKLMDSAMCGTVSYVTLCLMVLMYCVWCMTSLKGVGQSAEFSGPRVTPHSRLSALTTPLPCSLNSSWHPAESADVNELGSERWLPAVTESPDST